MSKDGHSGREGDGNDEMHGFECDEYEAENWIVTRDDLSSGDFHTLADVEDKLSE